MSLLSINNILIITFLNIKCQLYHNTQQEQGTVMKKRNCTHSLLGTDALQNHGVPSPYWVLFPVPTGYTMILIHICSQQELGTDAWSTLSLLGTEYILVHISTLSLLGTAPAGTGYSMILIHICSQPLLGLYPAGTGYRIHSSSH